MTRFEVTEEYLDDLMVRMAHHSTAIEGNTLTLGDTKSILLDGYIPHAMDMREFNEVHNYKDFMPILVQAIKEHREITLDFICEIHRILCNDAIETVPGEFKVIPNIVVGSDFIPTPPYMVRSALEDWRQNLFTQIELANGQNDKIIEAVCRQHIHFEHIHPFSDGNGRVGRMLMVYTCMESGVVPPVIPVTRRKEYIHYMNENDIDGLSSFSGELQQVESERLEACANGSSIGIILSNG